MEGPLPAPASDPAFERLLKRVCEIPALELEWVDLLSQLEYAGLRKIVKSVEFGRVSLEVLRHVSEESQHAFLLKEAAEREGLPRRSWGEGRFAAAGWGYFQGLDQAVSALPVEERFRYPGVSWAVERRVLALYPAYLRLTRRPAVREALRRIVAQEVEHAARFDRAEFPAGYRARVAAIEEERWTAFRGAFQGLVD
jgi:hypothetical protein